jgi:hypothetical protein
MSYNKKTWVSREIITKEALNNIENGIAELDKSLQSLTLGLHTDGLLYIFKDGEPIGNGIAMIDGETGDVIGNVDSANNIILYGNLQEGAYSIQYELEDGSLVTVGTLNIDGNDNTDTPIEPEEPGGTDEGVNYFDISTITLNSRLSSVGDVSAYNGMFVTDYIPVNVDMEKQVFKISGIDLVLSTDYKYCSRIIYYNSDKTMVKANNNLNSNTEESYMQPCFHGAGTENVDTSIAYVRISYVVKDNVEIAVDDVKNVVITTVDYYK